MTGPNLRAELARDGIFNTRDLGGLPTSSGRFVRPGMVLRGDSLQRASSSVEALRGYGVVKVIDLRDAAERDRAGVFDAEGIQVVHQPVLDPTFGWTTDEEHAPGGLLETLYRDILDSFGERLTGALSGIAEVVAGADSAPQDDTAAASGAVVFHCSLGKDRTGLVTALLLSLLGVDEDHIVSDYTRSANATAVQLQWLWSLGLVGDEIGDEDLSMGLWSAREQTMRSTLKWIDESFGGAVGYVLGHGLDAEAVATLRARLLTGDLNETRGLE